ncbi:MATE family efflux transporter [Flaviaesturariibacter terrae]
MNQTTPTVTAAQGKRKALVNFFSLSLLQIGNYVLPMVTLPIISRIIGPGNYGLINYIFAYVYYFVLFINAGFDLYGVRHIIQNRDNPEAINAVVSRIVAAKTGILAMCAVVFTVLVFCVPQLAREKSVCLFAFLYCFGWVINPSWMYHAMQETKKFAIFSFFSKLTFSVAIVLVIRERSDYIYHPLITSLAHVGVSFFSLRYALRRYGIRIVTPRFNQLLGTLKDIRHISAVELVRNQAQLTNIIIAGSLLPAHDTGFYTAGLRIVIIVQSIVSMPLNTVLFPIFGEAFVGSHEAGMERVRKTLPYVFLLTLLMSLGTLLLAPQLIGFVFGKEFIAAIPLLRIFCFGLLFSNLNTALGQHIMLNLKMDGPYMKYMLLGFAVNIGLLFALTRSSGATGAAMAWPLAELLVFLLFLAHFRLRSLKVIDPGCYQPMRFYRNALKLIPSRR